MTHNAPGKVEQLLDLVTDAHVLYDTGVFREEMARLRARLAELGAKKVQKGDSWFWILQPSMKLGDVIEL